MPTTTTQPRPASSPAPAVHVTRLAGTCPACGRVQKITADAVAPQMPGLPPRVSAVMVHHGYEVPGDGQGIVGDCWGVGAMPLEVSDSGARAYAVVVANQIDAAQAARAWLDSDDCVTLPRKTFIAGQGMGVVDVTRTNGAWAEVHKAAVYRADARIAALEDEAARVAAVIATWQPKPIRTIDEHDAPRAAAKAAAKQARTDARAAKLAKAVAFYQGRVDSGVKQRKPHLISDAFEAAQRKLRNDFDFRTVDAVPALGRDAVFAAFGLVVTEPADAGVNREICLNMSTSRYPWGNKIEWPAGL